MREGRIGIKTDKYFRNMDISHGISRVAARVRAQERMVPLKNLEDARNKKKKKRRQTCWNSESRQGATSNMSSDVMRKN
jgi:hypothetical protein